MAASEVMKGIIQNIQSSKLNFQINLTPFSAYITLRQSFIKNYTPSSSIFPSETPLLKENELLHQQNEELLKTIEDLYAVRSASPDTIKILEEKIGKVEESAYRAFQEKSQEISNLKDSIKKQESEGNSLRKGVNAANKVIKEKEKEIYRVVQKSENLNDTITKSKLEINSLKAEIKKLKKKPEKKVSTASVSTNTVQPTPTFCSPACKKLIPKSPIFSSNVTLPSSKPSASV